MTDVAIVNIAPLLFRYIKMRRLVWDSSMILVAVLLFTKGFLLMKLEIGRKSPSCSGQFDDNEKCWSLSPKSFKYQKLVILIIDALRYDFAFHHEHDITRQIFHNQMPVFHELMLKEGCKKARLWRFKADAPTTTMQRLKGLTTGSLPTFIDLSRNFASSEISEDNILDQLRASGKNITFMGDDTWMGLFPGRFNKAFAYPSFDVKDLHLVDNGIMKHLLPEIQTTDWQLLIAHFLGVDHCGHRYGPYHPEMPLKLQQMNEVVNSVIDTIDNQTLLLVMGDHGMTHTGDHGGETFNEVNAALFAYSPVGAFQNCGDYQMKEPIVNQVDIVPTISLLLGTSIPFANLGVVIGDMLPPESPDQDLSEGTNLQDAFLINAKQIHTYISVYQKMTNSLPHDSYTTLIRDYEELETLEKSSGSNTLREEKFLKYLKSAKEMCQLVWAKFNIALMLSALSLLVLWIVGNVNLSAIFLKTRFSMLVAVSVSLFLSLTISSEMNNIFSLLIFCVSFLLLCITGLIHVWHIFFSTSIFELVLPVLFLVIYSISFTSNSFILNEDLITLYLFISAFLCLSFKIFVCETFGKQEKDCKGEICQLDIAETSDQNSVNCSSEVIRRKKDSKITEEEMAVPSQNSALYSKDKLMVALYSFIGILCARVAFIFRCCRAEQFWCFDDTNGNDLVKSDYNVARVSASCISSISCIWGVMLMSKRELKLKSSFMIGCLLISCLLCMLSWILPLIPMETLLSLPDWYAVVLPRCVFAILIVFFTFHWIDPISTTLPYANKSPEHHLQTANGNEENFDDRRPIKGLEDIDIVSTVFFSSILMMIYCLVVLFCMLLGSTLATAILLWVISSACALQLMALLMHQKRSLFVPFGHVVVWNMMSSYWWFATGHQPSISSIRWDAAFVGFQGNHITNVVPAILLLLDTFSMQILASVSLPLLVFLHHTNWSWFNGDKRSGKVTGSRTCSWNREFPEILSDVFTKHYCFHVAKMIGVMVSASLHRRHLMVWWIFAPKFLFEGLSLIIVICASIFSYGCIRNIQRKLSFIL